MWIYPMERLISELNKLDKDVLYKDEINSLRYINEQVYNEMLDKITNTVPKKEKWEIEIEEDLKSLIYKDDNNGNINKFALKEVSVQKFKKD